MIYLINTRELHHCKMADALYRNWYNYSEIDTGENVLPIYQEIKETYQRYKTPTPDQKKIEVRKDEIKSLPEIAQGMSEAMENLRNSLPEIAQGFKMSLERFIGSSVTDEKSLMYRNTERNEVQLKDWLNRYERAFIKTYDAMIMPTGHDEKIWMYKNIKPNETRLYGLDIEGIAQVTATEVRTWQFIIDNLPFYEKYVFTDKPQQSDFDSDNAKNNLIFDETLIMNLHRELNDNVFLVPIDYFSFKNCFRMKPQKIKFQEGITVATICYIFGKIEHLNVGKNFTEWMKNHIGNNNYRSKKDEFIQSEKDAKEMKRNGFSLTIPQQRVIELKGNIDKRLKMILKD